MDFSHLVFAHVSRGNLVRMRALFLENRLAHFLVLGGLIFLLAPRPRSSRDIEVSAAWIDAVKHAQEKRLGRVLAPAEVAAVRERTVEDELLYREALRLGLDGSDAIVKQRLVQKALFLAEDLAGASVTPTDGQLAAFFEATRDQWTLPARVSLVHVYAGPERRSVLVDLREQLLQAEPAATDAPPPVGDAFALPRSVQANWDELARDYGERFANAVLMLSPRTWSKPIESKFGWHLVKVLDRKSAGPASYDEVKGKVALAYLIAKKKRAVSDFLIDAETRYRIRVDGKPADLELGSGRVPPERPPTQDLGD